MIAGPGELDPPEILVGDNAWGLDLDQLDRFNLEGFPYIPSLQLPFATYQFPQPIRIQRNFQNLKFHIIQCIFQRLGK
jgi:hypothetical protein